MSGSKCVRTQNTIVGCHPSILEVQRLAKRVAPTSLPVMITGETGTGKELLARSIHDMSPARSGPFVVTDCGVLSREIAPSELFGHLRGAFTGAAEPRCGLVETAGGGTLFLDEIGELHRELQPHLLRLAQDGEYRPVGDNRMRRASVRLIAATNRNLEDDVQSGRFRQDLFHRLNVVHLHLLPLRERMDDLPVLIGHFIETCRARGTVIRPFSSESRDMLQKYPWPGNVRELSHAIAHALVMAEHDEVMIQDFPPHIVAHEETREADLYRLPFKEARKRYLKRFGREYLHRALIRSGGNVSLAARECGIGRQYFQARLTEYGIRAAPYRQKK